MKLITSPSEWPRICKWVNDGLPYNTKIATIDGAVGIEKDGELVGGTTIVNSNGVNAYSQIRMLTPKSLTRGLIEKTFYHAFVTLKLKRLSNSIIGDNMASIRFTRKIGFELEGILIGVTEKEEDVYLSVMRPEFCRYLKV